MVQTDAEDMTLYQYNVCVSNDGGSVLVIDLRNHLVRRFNRSDGQFAPFAGSSVCNLKNGLCLEAAFAYPRSICPDPIRAGCYYIGDLATVRYCDGQSVTLIAGRMDAPEIADNVGDVNGPSFTARFHSVHGLLCTADGQTLYVSDEQNHKLKAINIGARSVSTIAGSGSQRSVDAMDQMAGIGYPCSLCFDRFPASASSAGPKKPESALFVATDSGIRHFDLTTRM